MSVATWPTLPPQNVSSAMYPSRTRGPSKSPSNEDDNHKHGYQSSVHRAPSYTESMRTSTSQSTSSSQSTGNSTSGVSLSSLKARVKSLGSTRRRRDVGDYTGFDVYEQEQRQARQQRASNDTSASTSPDLTLLDTEHDPPAYTENIEEHSSRKSVKAEKRKSRWSKMFFAPVDFEYELEHDAKACGWACSRHRYLTSRGSLEWWSVAGMYM